MRAVLAALLVGWAAASLSGVTPLAARTRRGAGAWVLVLLPVGIAAYAFAALRYLELYRERRRPLPLAMAVAFVLLAEALVAVAFSRAWHTSWWEWHVLMAIAFGAILIAARHEYRRERSFSGAFGGLYLERTLEHVDRRHRAALGELVAAVRDDEPLGRVAERLRERGLHRRRDLGASTDRPGSSRAWTDCSGATSAPAWRRSCIGSPTSTASAASERQITALFADLAGFTTFSDDRSAPEVVDMLNTYWEAVVPAVVDEEGGLIERFAGDAILAVFNALGDQPDHELRAARAAIGIRERTERLRAGRDGWPRFRVGLNTGPAVVGTVGAGDQRSFAAIGDTTNVAARLQSLAQPGQILVGPITFEKIADRAVLEPLGPVELKGKSLPIDAHVLVSMDAEATVNQARTGSSDGRGRRSDAG